MTINTTGQSWSWTALLTLLVIATGCDNSPKLDQLPPVSEDAVEDNQEDEEDPDDPGDDMDYDPPQARPSNTACLAPNRPPPPGDIALQPVFENILTPAQTNEMVALVPSPHQPGRWYTVHQSGLVHTFHQDDTQATVFINIADKIWKEHREAGLMHLTFHPDFANNGTFFLVYSAPGGGRLFQSRLARFQSPDRGLTGDPQSETVLIDVPQPVAAHNGNQALFGPDGMLYFAVGDGGTPGSSVSAQRTNDPKGSILRIDPDNIDTERNKPYAIPPDNPFPDTLAPEIWAMGLRNVWRFSFDRDNGQLWAADVGNEDWEEVNVIERGGNYGWPILEGNECNKFNGSDCDPGDTIAPFYAYSHTEGRSITGGYVYRGNQIPAIDGAYLFADYINGNIWAARTDQQPAIVSLQLESGVNVSSFAQGPDGELYVVSYSRENEGQILQIVPAPQTPDTFPRSLSLTGCFDPQDARKPAQGVFVYDVQAPLWSDGSQKERFMAIPDNRRITVDDTGDLLFPRGSVLIKHFKYDDHYHETRLLVHHEDGWAGYSYEWNEAQTDAALLDLGKTVELPNGMRWTYPSRGQCMACHTQAAGRSLGLEVLQLNRTFDPGDGSIVNQLQWLLDHDFFSPELTELADLHADTLPQMPSPLGSDASVEDRARAYLHANCASCHQPGANTGRGDVDLRYTTAFKDAAMCDAPPQAGWPWYIQNGDQTRLIVPGDPDKSLIYHRMETLRSFRMPPLGSAELDAEGLDLMHTWIEGLQQCP